MERNPQTLGIEHPPRKGPPLPKHFFPGGMRYKVSDGEDWESVAKQFKVDVQTLINFNFHTTDSAVVNWYLHRNVGCYVPTPDGFNWKFSSSANPGYIYIPGIDTNVNLPAGWLPGPGGQTSLAQWLDNLPEEEPEIFSPEAAGFILNFVEAAHVAASVFEMEGLGGAMSGIAEAGFADLGLELAGPIAGYVAFWVEIGGAYKDVIDNKKRNWALRGLSLGVVLGANGARDSYIKWTFENKGNKQYFHDAEYPEQEINFEKFYRVGLWTGVGYGRKLNRVESKKLFKILQKTMGWNSDDVTKPWVELDDSAHKKYYEGAALQFRLKFLPR
jgi:hypothetical protein